MKNETKQEYKRGYNAGFEAGELVGKHFHPVKELTDEEITAIWYEPTLRYDPVAFARAILKKASEK
jgi:hypothetical protein